MLLSSLAVLYWIPGDNRDNTTPSDVNCKFESCRYAITAFLLYITLCLVILQPEEEEELEEEEETKSEENEVDAEKDDDDEDDSAAHEELQKVEGNR